MCYVLGRLRPGEVMQKLLSFALAVYTKTTGLQLQVFCFFHQTLFTYPKNSEKNQAYMSLIMLRIKLLLHKNKAALDFIFTGLMLLKNKKKNKWKKHP